MRPEMVKKGPVWVVSAGAQGRVIGESRPGSFKVLVQGEIVELQASDLEPMDENVIPYDRTRKTARLGKFTPGPMQVTTLDLYGMKPKDAVEVLERKVQRAILADARSLKILHPPTDHKFRRTLHEYLDTSKIVERHEEDEEKPGITWIYLRTMREMGH